MQMKIEVSTDSTPSIRAEAVNTERLSAIPAAVVEIITDRRRTT
jgi:hypothetical protein